MKMPYWTSDIGGLITGVFAKKSKAEEHAKKLSTLVAMPIRVGKQPVTFFLHGERMTRDFEAYQLMDDKGQLRLTWDIAEAEEFIRERGWKNV